MIDHAGIYGSRVAEGLSAFNVGLVLRHIVHIILSRKFWPTMGRTRPGAISYAPLY